MTTTAITTQKPHLVIEPSQGRQIVNLRELWQFRDLLLIMANRDIKLRYRQTALGALWVILQPILTAGIFSFVFGKVGKFPSDGVPYFVFTYAGLLGWNAFSGTLNRAASSLTGNTNLVSKVFFPRLILPLSTIFSTLIDFGVALFIMSLLMIKCHIVPGPGLALLPVWLLLLVILAMGIGLYAAALMVSYRDIGFILPVLIQFLLYACPVFYAVSAVPVHLRVYYFLNPLAGILNVCRWSLLGTGHPMWGMVLYSAVISFVIFFGGAMTFKKMERKFADVI